MQLLPLARIKKMMKDVQDVKMIAADASWAVARAAVSAPPLLVDHYCQGDTAKDTLPQKDSQERLACHWQRGHDWHANRSGLYRAFCNASNGTCLL